MAFDKDQLFRGAFYGSSVWRYHSDDSIDDVLLSSYFVDVWPQLKAGDLILASVSEGLSILSVSSASSEEVIVELEVQPGASGALQDLQSVLEEGSHATISVAEATMGVIYDAGANDMELSLGSSEFFVRQDTPGDNTFRTIGIDPSSAFLRYSDTSTENNTSVEVSEDVVIRQRNNDVLRVVGNPVAGESSLLVECRTISLDGGALGTTNVTASTTNIGAGANTTNLGVKSTAGTSDVRVGNIAGTVNANVEVSIGQFQIDGGSAGSNTVLIGGSSSTTTSGSSTVRIAFDEGSLTTNVLAFFDGVGGDRQVLTTGSNEEIATALNTLGLVDNSAVPAGDLVQPVQATAFLPSRPENSQQRTTYPVDTTGSPFVGTMTGTFNPGDQIQFIDYINNFSTNNFTIDFGTHNFEGAAASTLVMSVDGGSVTLEYIDSTRGFQRVSVV